MRNLLVSLYPILLVNVGPFVGFLECICLGLLLVPAPSTDEKAWWDTPGKASFRSVTPPKRLIPKPCIDGPSGLVSIEEIQQIDLYCKGNPFESLPSSPLAASPTTSDEELFTSALALQTPLTPVQIGTRRLPPPPPRSGKDSIP